MHCCLQLDYSVIAIMEDSDLSKYVTLFGDRIAIKQYCRNAVCDEKTESNKTGTRKELLLAKLRTKLASRKRTSAMLQDAGEGSADHCALKTSSGNTNAYKKSRLIEMGWLHEGKQVRAKNGGGTRSVLVPKSATKQELLVLAKELFFQDGSKFGQFDEFVTDVCDFKMQPLRDSVSVAEMYENIKLPKLRVYLATSTRGQRKSQSVVEPFPDDDDSEQPVGVSKCVL